MGSEYFIMDRGELLTPSEASRILHVSRSMVYHLIKTGAIRGYQEKGKRRTFVVKADVEGMARGKVILERKGG